jgi:nucleoside-diphosphate-sugar epimerase
MRAYREEDFPLTIVRPSLTYGETLIPLAVNSWQNPYTVVDRMLRGEKVIVPGDGSSLWVITHNSDFAKGFVGLIGNEQAIGQAFHITSDEVMTWDHYYRIVGRAAGVEPKLVHITSDFIAACVPAQTGSLIGDKAVSVVFDNTKIKSYVPDFCATTRFADGISRSLGWFEADASRKQLDQEANATWDKLIRLYERGLDAAQRDFSRSASTQALDTTKSQQQ